MRGIEEGYGGGEEVDDGGKAMKTGGEWRCGIMEGMKGGRYCMKGMEEWVNERMEEGIEKVMEDGKDKEWE